MSLLNYFQKINKEGANKPDSKDQNQSGKKQINNKTSAKDNQKESNKRSATNSNKTERINKEKNTDKELSGKNKDESNGTEDKISLKSEQTKEESDVDKTSSKETGNDKNRARDDDVDRKKAAKNKTKSEVVFPEPVDEYEFANDNMNHVDKPIYHGRLELPEGKVGLFEGLRFCISGSFKYFKREQINKLIESCGGSAKSSISSRTDFFLRGSVFVSRKKEDDAKAKNIPIVDEKGFLSIFGISVEEVDKKCMNEKSSSKIVLNSNFGISFGCSETMESTIYIEKYRPKDASELIGNQEQIEEIRRWLTGYQKSRSHKALLLSGPPGVGKTTAAIVIAKELGYHVIEFNASDNRDKSSVGRICSEVLDSNSLYAYNKDNGKKPLVIFDEIDGMSSGDKGGISTLASYLKNAVIPVICICNEKKYDKMKHILQHCREIAFNNPLPKEIAVLLSKIAAQENIKLKKSDLKTLVEKVNADFRSCINSLQFWKDGIQTSSHKDTSVYKTQYQALMKMYKQTLHAAFDSFFLDYYNAPILTNEIVHFNGSFKDYADAYESISMGDLITSFMHEENNFDMLPASAVACTIYPLKTSFSTTIREPKLYAHIPFLSKLNSNSSNIKDLIARTSRAIDTRFSSIFNGTIDVLAYYVYDMLNDGDEKSIEMVRNELNLSDGIISYLREFCRYDNYDRIPNTDYCLNTNRKTDMSDIYIKKL